MSLRSREPSKRVTILAATLALIGTVTSLTAQERPLAIRNARILTIGHGVIERGTVLLHDGKIAAVGKDVEVPAGAEVVDARGGTLMPGLVSAYSQTGLSSHQNRGTPFRFRGRVYRSRGRSSASAATSAAAKKVADQLYARQDVFGDLLRTGVTTLAVHPSGGGFPGRGAILDPAGRDSEHLTLDDTAFVEVVAATGTKSKKLIKETLEKAAKVVEERHKKPEPAASDEEKDSEKKSDEKKDGGKKEGGEKKGSGEKPPADKKEAQKKGPEKKAEKKPKPKPKDPNLEVLADLLEGKARGFFELGSANDFRHFLDCKGDTAFPVAVIAVPSYDNTEGRLDLVLDEVAKWKAPVLLPVSLTTETYSRAVVNPAARFAAAGVEVGFVLGDTPAELRNLFFELCEQVRYGLDHDKALAAVTSVPAKALGVEDRVGSIAEGRDADLLLFHGDPLDPTSRLTRIWHHGREVDLQHPAAGGTR